MLKKGLLRKLQQALSLSTTTKMRSTCRQGRAWAVLLRLTPVTDARVRGGVRSPDEPGALSSLALELAAPSLSSSLTSSPS